MKTFLIILTLFHTLIFCQTEPITNMVLIPKGEFNMGKIHHIRPIGSPSIKW